jgi:predicted MFS family arabinose efflux permease
MFKNLNRQQKQLLLVLTLINLVNYVDRQVVFPLFHNIKMEFGISDFSLGLLGTMFMLVHSVTSLPLGVLADKYSRKKVIAGGVLFWSIASFAGGLAQNFKTLLGIRSLVGIGEAAYAPAATAMISDNIPHQYRSQAQGVFNAGLFIGGTLGAMLGGVVAYYTHSWRAAFFLVSLPGLVLAWSSFRLKDTRQGEKAEKIDWHKLFKNAPYIWILIGGWFSTFASGAFVSWGIEFVVRYKNYNLRDTSLILGLTLMVAGLLGVLGGSWLADHLQKKIAWGHGITLAVSQMLAAPIMYLGLSSRGSGGIFFVFFFLGTFFLSFYYGPVTALMHDVVPAHLRATAFAAYILIIHLLGDALSPAAVGRVSDHSSLRTGLKLCTIFVFLSGVAFLQVCDWIRKNQKRPNAINMI